MGMTIKQEVVKDLTKQEVFELFKHIEQHRIHKAIVLIKKHLLENAN
jgi:hypothetical protein